MAYPDLPAHRWVLADSAETPIEFATFNRTGVITDLDAQYLSTCTMVPALYTSPAKHLEALSLRLKRYPRFYQRL